MRVRVQNAGGIKNVENRIKISRFQFQADSVYAIRMIQLFAKQGLESLLGDGATHFEVRLWGNKASYQIIIEAKDDIGKFIYEGTKPHWIGTDGQYLENLSVSAGSEFRASGPVWHPGTPARGPEIEAEMRMAVEKALVFIK